MPSKTWAGFMWSDEFTMFFSTCSFKNKEMEEKKLIASRPQQVLNGLQKLGAVPEWIKSCWSELSLLDLSSFHSSLGARLRLVIFLSPGIQFPKTYLFSMLQNCYDAFVGTSCIQPSELWKVLKVASYQDVRKWNGTKKKWYERRS